MGDDLGVSGRRGQQRDPSPTRCFTAMLSTCNSTLSPKGIAYIRPKRSQYCHRRIVGWRTHHHNTGWVPMAAFELGRILPTYAMASPQNGMRRTVKNRQIRLNYLGRLLLPMNSSRASPTMRSHRTKPSVELIAVADKTSAVYLPELYLEPP